jgi:hypothetical protein
MCLALIGGGEDAKIFIVFVVFVPSVILFAQDIKSLIAVNYQASPIG